MISQAIPFLTRLLVCSWLLAFAAAAAPVDTFNVAWDSPSINHHGSMPLGNGDIALNAWMTPDGDLHFYISKTDAWDDNARLVKVGKVRVHFEPNPVTSGRIFRQELKLNEGCVEVTLRPEAAAPPSTTIRLWVDANNPVVHVTADSAIPLEATAFVEMWRTNQQELAEVQTSDIMNHAGKPQNKHAPTIIEPDTVLTNQRDRIGWFHHNIKSVGPKLLAEVQGLTGFEMPDPLLHRTFGGVVTAVKGERLDDLRLRSPRGTSHRFSVFVLARHPATPERWLADMEDTMRRVEAQDFATRRAAHEKWWGDFWNRSWIRATTSTNVKTDVASIVPKSSHPVRIGMDQAGGNKFTGELGRVSVYAGALTAEQIAVAATTRSPLGGSAAASGRSTESRPKPLFTGTNLQSRVLADSAAWDFTAGLTVEVWVRPEALGGGGARLVDRITPGGSDGFLLDTHPGNSLRFICGQTQLTAKDAAPAGKMDTCRCCRRFRGGRLPALR